MVLKFKFLTSGIESQTHVAIQWVTTPPRTQYTGKADLPVVCTYCGSPSSVKKRKDIHATPVPIAFKGFKVRMLQIC